MIMRDQTLKLVCRNVKPPQEIYLQIRRLYVAMSSGIFRIGFRGFDLDHVKRFPLADQTIYTYV
jgi:hypothetical protein